MATDVGDHAFMFFAVVAFASVAVMINPVSFSYFVTTLVYESDSLFANASVFTDNEHDVTPAVAHLPTPQPLKAVYMTSWVAGTPHIRARVIDLIDTTEINSVIIDIKDDTGKISFLPHNELLKEYGAGTNRIADIDALLALLHEKNIYVIGRVSVFQDPHLALARPELAVSRASDGAPWHDRKGLAWLDVGGLSTWDYVVAIARESYARGFDEINFDYVRFPTDGNTNDMFFPFSQGRRRDIALEEFFSYLAYTLEDDPFPISADFFGLVTTQDDDMGIGQVLERALPYFDYVAPMVYPSHFGKGVYGIANPAEDPYQTVYRAMSSAVTRAINASTTPAKLRPWLQDFNLGADYTAEMVRAQIDATYDTGLTSWMLWNPANTYTKSALLTR